MGVRKREGTRLKKEARLRIKEENAVGDEPQKNEPLPSRTSELQL